jgi:anti-sigma factor ChrR (cupin superfamily)
MRCEDVSSQLADYLAGTLTDAALVQMREHLTACASCRTEVEAMDDTWQLLGSVAAEPADSTAMRARLDAALAGYQQGLGERSRRSVRELLTALWPPRLVLQAASAGALLLIGVLLGRQASPPPAPAADPQIASLRGELGDMRRMVTLSLLQQQSASERLRGVTFTSQLDEPGTEVVAALLDTLKHDANVNVRLASIDALKRFAERDVVRRGAIEALPGQTSPLVQIALIDFVLEATGTESAAILRRLSQDTMLDAAVRTRAARGLQQLGVTS